MIRIDHVKSDMTLNDLGHQPIYRAPARGDHVQSGVATPILAWEGIVAAGLREDTDFPRILRSGSRLSRSPCAA